MTWLWEGTHLTPQRQGDRWKHWQEGSQQSLCVASLILSGFTSREIASARDRLYPTVDCQPLRGLWRE